MSQLSDGLWCLLCDVTAIWMVQLTGDLRERKGVSAGLRACNTFV